MECSFRSNYSLRFYHDELSEVGFDANHLTRLYRYTADDLIKFEVAWDDEMSPHFSFQHGYPVIDSGSAPGSFYIHFVQWLRNKTGVMTYRIIHKRNTVNALFKPHEEDVQLASPTFGGEYDFSGSKRYKANLWTISKSFVLGHQNFPTHRLNLPLPANPAMQRVIGDALVQPVIKEDARRGGRF